MAILNFPPNPNVGDQYTISGVTYTWNGYAWLKTNQGNQTFSNVTSTNTITVGTGSTTVVINSTTVIINGSPAITSATLFSSIVNSITAGTDISVSTSTASIIISDISTLQSVTSRGSSSTFAISLSNNSASTSTTTGALTVVGGVGIGGDTNIGGNIATNGDATVAGNAYVTGRVNAESVKIADAIFDSTQVLVNTTATVVVDSYSITDFRSSKYLVQIDEGSGPTAAFEVIEILLLVDNVGTVYATEYGLLTSNGEMGDFAADVQGDNMVRLYFTPYQATNKVIKVLRTGMTV